MEQIKWNLPYSLGQFPFISGLTFSILCVCRLSEVIIYSIHQNNIKSTTKSFPIDKILEAPALRYDVDMARQWSERNSNYLMDLLIIFVKFSPNYALKLTRMV